MPESPVWEPVVVYDRTFDARYGLELLEHDGEAGELRGRIAVREGTIHAHARAVHRGERQWVWTVDATGDDERPLAHSRVTVAVRPLRRPE
jgi:hypothetical protein